MKFHLTHIQRGRGHVGGERSALGCRATGREGVAHIVRRIERRPIAQPSLRRLEGLLPDAIYVLTSGEAIGFEDAAGALSEITGKPVTSRRVRVTSRDAE